MLTIKECEGICGTLSKPSKMPAFGYSIPAMYCKVGSKLRKIKNSVCSACYALKGRYMFSNVVKALEKRFASLSHPRWVECMSFMISKKCAKKPWFRWHDAGDIQDMFHLLNIVQVAKNTPEINHWLPTREYAIIKAYLKSYGPFPKNLVVRVSAPTVGRLINFMGLNTSSVDVKGSKNCPAPTQGGKCEDCRACWDATVPNVNYHKH